MSSSGSTVTLRPPKPEAKPGPGLVWSWDKKQGQWTQAKKKSHWLMAIIIFIIIVIIAVAITLVAVYMYGSVNLGVASGVYTLTENNVYANEFSITVPVNQPVGGKDLTKAYMRTAYLHTAAFGGSKIKGTVVQILQGTGTAPWGVVLATKEFSSFPAGGTPAGTSGGLTLQTYPTAATDTLRVMTY